MDDHPPIDPPDDQQEPGEGAPPPDRFPTIVLAGPGCLCLLFVLAGSGVSGGRLLFPGMAALAASVFFGVIASRTREKNTQTLWTLAAFLGPVLFCLTLMARM